MTVRARVSLLVLLLAVLAAFVLAPQAPLLVFGAALTAVALRALADPLGARLGLPGAASVLLVVLAISAALALAVWAAAGPLAAQADEFARTLPASVMTLHREIGEYSWGQWVLERLSPLQFLPSAGQAAGRAATALAGTFGVLGDVVLVALLGIYLALDPAPYLGGLRALLAPSLRAPADALLREAGATLRGWLAGVLFSMTVTGLVTWLGLWLLGMPLAGLLATLTALLGFIPYIGPVIAAVPALLVALALDPWLVPWVIGLFVVVQTIEGNILTPLVQARAADMPPALLLAAQLLLGAVFGLLGVALAAPLAAVAVLVVRGAYVERWLGQE